MNNDYLSAVDTIYWLNVPTHIIETEIKILEEKINTVKYCITMCNKNQKAEYENEKNKLSRLLFELKAIQIIRKADFGRTIKNRELYESVVNKHYAKARPFGCDVNNSYTWSEYKNLFPYEYIVRKIKCGDFGFIVPFSLYLKRVYEADEKLKQFEVYNEKK